MASEWMGRYRPLIAALVAHGNKVARTAGIKGDIGDGICLSATEWQILEYIIENRSETFNMIDMSRRLEIPQSSFSKTVKMLCSIGLVEKYQAVNNRKNIILKPTEYALQLYDRNVSVKLKEQFRDFFEALADVDDESIRAMTKAIPLLTKKPGSADDSALPELILKK